MLKVYISNLIIEVFVLLGLTVMVTLIMQHLNKYFLCFVNAIAALLLVMWLIDLLNIYFGMGV